MLLRSPADCKGPAVSDPTIPALLLCVARTPARPKLTSTQGTRDGSSVFILYPHHIPYSPQKVTKLKVALLAR